MSIYLTNKVIKMKRFVIFSFEDYEASGGWNDVVRDEDYNVCSFDTKKEAKTYAVKNISHHNTTQIIDLHTGEEQIF